MLKILTTKRDSLCAMHGAFSENGTQIGDKILWQRCPKCARIQAEKSDKEHEVLEAKAKQDRVEKMFECVGIPKRFRDKNFCNFLADSHEKKEALTLAKNFSESFEEHKKNGATLVFSGLPGTGKSHLALAIAQEIMARNTVFYTSAIDAVRTVRETWRKNSEKSEKQVLDMFASVDLLIIDEVGVQYGTEAEQVTLFDIIDKRYRDMMPIILLTNENREGFRKFLGDRSFDRLREQGEWVKFEWESYRARKKLAA